MADSEFPYVVAAWAVDRERWRVTFGWALDVERPAGGVVVESFELARHLVETCPREAEGEAQCTCPCTCAALTTGHAPDADSPKPAAVRDRPRVVPPHCGLEAVTLPQGRVVRVDLAQTGTTKPVVHLVEVVTHDLLLGVGDTAAVRLARELADMPANDCDIACPILINLTRPQEKEHNVNRYRITIAGGGYHGLLVSDRTRIPGLISIYDIVPTAEALD